MNGSSDYNIMFNGLYFKTSSSELNLDLKAGINTIRVSTNLECQGVFEETIFISEDILLSPNPANNVSKLWVGGNDNDINMTLFDVTGRIIWTKQDKVPYTRSLNLPFNDLSSGIYILQVDSETVNKSIKVIKE